MKIWIRMYRDNIDLSNTSCGIESTAYSLYLNMQKLGLPVCWSDPMERCIELWVGWEFVPKRGNINIMCSTGGSSIISYPNWQDIDMVFYSSESLVRNIDIPRPKHLWHHHNVDPTIFTINKYNNYPFIFVNASCAVFKGIDIVCQSFRKTFGNSRDVELNIFYPGEYHEAIEYKKKYRSNNILFCQQWWDSREGSWRLYAGHCYVYPTMADSFALTVWEAMCSGLPVIMSDIPIFREFFNDNCGWWLNMYPGEPEYGMGGHPTIEDTSKVMKYVYEHQDEVSVKGKYAAQYIRDNYTYSNCIEKEFIPVMEKNGFI